tara:strand:+ start:8142 stop:8999 length:858 start_codon:yes stop_codon:yes gene_type:complete
MIIIGNKSYKKIDLNEIIDSFEKNIRLNLSLPNNNNGTKKYFRYTNGNVYDNIEKKQVVKYIKLKGLSEEYVNLFENTYIPKDYICIFKQNNNYKQLYNRYLEKISCPHSFKKLPRLGCNAIFDILLKLNNTEKIMDNNEKIYITHFSLYYDENNNHQYINLDKTPECHCFESEALILRWLHMNNYIDATLCAVQDTELPSIDCKYIKPSNYITHRLLNKYGICIFKNFFFEDETEKIGELIKTNDEIKLFIIIGEKKKIVLVNNIYKEGIIEYGNNKDYTQYYL